jgi:hypothetical protein
MAYPRNREQWTEAITGGKIVIEMPVDPLHTTSSDAHKSYWIDADELVNSDSKAFTDLSDVDIANYTGKAGHNIRVNSEETELESIDPATQLYGLIHAASSKTTPVDADELGIWDSVANGLKKLTWANLKATLKAYFDTLYQVLLVSGTNIKTVNGNSLLGSGNITISGGSGTDDHSELENLDWTDSGHTGTPNRLAAFAPGTNGEAIEVAEPIFSNIKFGRYYNWYAVSNEDFAPSGWHVPTQADWETLLDAIDTYDSGEDEWPVAGSLLKDTELLYWESVGTNQYNFSAKGSGERGTGIRSFANYWTATEGVRARINGNAVIISDGEVLTDGYCVCLVKDNSTDSGFLEDIDGNVYRTVKIGSQVWVVHWACTKLNDGTPIEEILDNGEWEAATDEAYCNYLNDLSYTFKVSPTIHTYPLEVNLSVLDTDLTAAAGVAKFPCPENMTIVSAFVQVTTAPTGSAAQWDINVEGSSIMDDLIVIEAGEYSSLDATTQPSFTDADVDEGEDFVIDRDAVGATVAGQNDVLTIIYKKR